MHVVLLINYDCTIVYRDDDDEEEEEEEEEGARATVPFWGNFPLEAISPILVDIACQQKHV